MEQRRSRFTTTETVDQVSMVTVSFEEEELRVQAGISVAAALLGHSDTHFCRSAGESDKRAPYCLMGVCFECLVEIDGMKNRQACLEPVYEGMRVKRQYVQSDEANEEQV